MKAIHHILTHCGNVKPGEEVFIIGDLGYFDIPNAFANTAREIGALVSLTAIRPLTRHGEEPPRLIAEAIQTTDLTISLCRHSLAHTHARRDSKCRFLSLPGYSWDVLHDPCVMVDYEAQAAECERFADAFTNGKTLRVTALNGTDVTCYIEGRKGNACPGFVRNPGDLGSPPDIEANVAPIERTAHGCIVSDSPKDVLWIQEGMATVSISSNPQHHLLAEVGVGLNPLAKICGNLLIDEGAIGSVHFGFGSNLAHGGLNDTDFHTDFVVADASIYVDGVKL